MSWTAYDAPVVARKMTSLALQELGRWLVEPEFHEPWNVFVKWLKHIRLEQATATSILDVGCASGYYLPVIRRYFSDTWNYYGCDRSGELLALGRIFFGHGINIWHPLGGGVSQEVLPSQTNAYDVVLSGSMLQHEEHWEQALAEQVRVCRRWLIIHKIPIADTLVQRQKQAYGVTMNEWNFPVWLIHEKVGRKPVEEHWFASAEPHWSGLYDLEA